MRAKTVNNFFKRAYCFDFDETLFVTDAKIHIIKNGQRISSLTPTEFNSFEPGPGETINVDDFTDARIILQAKKYKMWPVIRNVDIAKKSGDTNSEIFILTARSSKSKQAIHNLLTREDINIPLDHIMTIGPDDGTYFDIATSKKNILEKMSKEFDEILFFDDNPKNIESASIIPNVKTRLIEDKYIK